VTDSCGNESELSPRHKTIHLTINEGLSNTINLIWDHYEGFTFGTYYIYRYSASTGWELRDSMASDQTSWTDFSPPAASLWYRVEVKHPAGCLPAIALAQAGTPTLAKILTYNSAQSNVTNRLLPTGILPWAPGAGNLAGLKVYPNPFNDRIIVESSAQLKSQKEKCTIEIYNTLGQIVYTLNLNNLYFKYSIDLSFLPEGLYNLKIIQENNFYYNSRIVKH